MLEKFIKTLNTVITTLPLLLGRSDAHIPHPIQLPMSASTQPMVQEYEDTEHNYCLKPGDYLLTAKKYDIGGKHYSRPAIVELDADLNPEYIWNPLGARSQMLEGRIGSISASSDGCWIYFDVLKGEQSSIYRVSPNGH